MNGFKSIPPVESRLPNNVKQIGKISGAYCVYIEDYVYTYLYQNSKEGITSEKVFFLVGDNMQCEQGKAILIKGAIEGKYVIDDDGELILTSQTWDYVKDTLDKYFNGCKLIGWSLSQPDYGVIITGQHYAIHKDFFDFELSTLFIYDPMDRNDVFYIWKEGELSQLSGYFIYYERNEMMHEYMVSNKKENRKNVIKDVQVKKQSESNEINTRKKNIDSNASDRYTENYEKKDFINRKKSSISRTKKVNARKINIKERRLNLKEPSLKQTKAKARKNEKDEPTTKYEKIINMLTSFSAVLFTVCVLLVIGLLNNMDSVHELEQKITKLNAEVSSNKEIFKQSQRANAIPKEVIVVEGGQDVTENLDQSEQVQGQQDNKIPEFYVVKNGDSLNNISTTYYKDIGMVKEIMKLNDIKDPNKIYPGQKLLLPK